MQIRYNKKFEKITKKQFLKFGQTCDTTTFINRTGNECFYNKITIDSLINDDQVNTLFAFRCGISSAVELMKKLNSLYTEHFSVILTYNGENTTVRFHKIRNNEAWLADNLEGYKEEAILQIIN